MLFVCVCVCVNGSSLWVYTSYLPKLWGSELCCTQFSMSSVPGIVHSSLCRADEAVDAGQADGSVRSEGNGGTCRYVPTSHRWWWD